MGRTVRRSLGADGARRMNNLRKQVMTQTTTKMGGLHKEGCEKDRGGRQVEGEGCRQGEVERDNGWGGAAIHEQASPLIEGATWKIRQALVKYCVETGIRMKYSMYMWYIWFVAMSEGIIYLASLTFKTAFNVNYNLKIYIF